MGLRRGGLVALAALVAIPLCPKRAHATEVVVVRHSAVPAYQEAFDEFSERCRLPTRVVPLDSSSSGPLDQRIGAARILVTFGQDALDATHGRRERRIALLAAYSQEGALLAPTTGTPTELLRALKIAMPRARTVGVIVGPRQEPWLVRATEAAQRSGLTMLIQRPTDGAAAVRALHKIAGQIDAIWLPPDPDVISPQVFRYALQLQLERHIALVAATRQQVHSGALLAIDFPPRSLGRAAADVINRWVERPQQDPQFPPLASTITVNRTAARRLSADLPALVAIGARLE